MNEKIRRHIDVIFAAAPKTAKAAELKEELLHNLNDKYEDLLKSGYDSTAAFHIALSGIGDIDELFQACRDDCVPAFQPEAVSQGNKANMNATPTQRSRITPVLVAIAIGLFVMGPGCVVFFEQWRWDHFGVTAMFACWAVAVGLIAYYIVRSIQNSGGNATSPNESTTTSGEISVQHSMHQSEISRKRIAAGILAILLGVFGVHKFYLGFKRAGLAMLILTLAAIYVKNSSFGPPPTYSFLPSVIAIIGLIEGIIYLTKSDREFYRDYIVQKRTWF